MGEMRVICFFDVLALLNIYVSVSYPIGWNGWNSIFGKIIVIVCWSVDLTEHSLCVYGYSAINDPVCIHCAAFYYYKLAY